VLSVRAKRDGRELRIDESAWKVMVAHGVAPEEVPDDVTIVP
jgi:hypothetical protein